MRWPLVLLLVACREDGPATRRAPDPHQPAPAPLPALAPLPPLDPILQITIEPGYPAPKKVLLRTEEPGAAWQEIALTGRVYRAPRPTTTFSLAVICGSAAHVLALGPADRYPLRMPCPLIDGKGGYVSLTSDRPTSFLSLDGPYGIGSLTDSHPEDSISVPAEGAWDILATDDASGTEEARQFAIARGMRSGGGAAYRFTRWYRPERATVIVRNAPTTGTWSLTSILRTSNGTTTTLQRSTDHPAVGPGHPEQTLDVLVAPQAALVPGDCMQIFVDACEGSWCRATSSCTREIAFHEGPTAPITRVPGPGVVIDVGSFHDADIVNVRSTGFRDDKAFEIFVTATRAWLSAHATGGKLTIPVVPGFADAASDKARYLWLALVWGLAPTTALPYEGGAWQRATTSIDFTGGPRPP
ncbi:MAG: hypothetical protein IPQ07_18230 [Myxococcales bacterium]|nr:hypothetical protein [Myxococcales bacterium]